MIYNCKPLQANTHGWALNTAAIQLPMGAAEGTSIRYNNRKSWLGYYILCQSVNFQNYSPVNGFKIHGYLIKSEEVTKRITGFLLIYSLKTSFAQYTWRCCSTEQPTAQRTSHKMWGWNSAMPFRRLDCIFSLKNKNHLEEFTHLLICRTQRQINPWMRQIYRWDIKWINRNMWYVRQLVVT